MIPGGIHPLLLAGAGGVRVQDVFATVLATGANLQAAFDATGITPNLLIGKNRANAADWAWRSAAVGLGQKLASNTTAAASAFSGYSGSDNHVGYAIKSAPDFYGELTYTGDGVAGRQIDISHLGFTKPPGMVICKAMDLTQHWQVGHTALGWSAYMLMNSTYAATTGTSAPWNNTAPTKDVVTLGNFGPCNNAGTLYVMLVFGHNTDADGIIQCGSFVTSASPSEVVLNWRPQWLMLKGVSEATGWYIMDSVRGLNVNANNDDRYLSPNLSNAEAAGANLGDFTNNGFIPPADGQMAGAATTIAYMAIRAAA